MPQKKPLLGLDEKKVIEMLTATHGNVSLASQKLGVNRRTIHRHMKKNPALRQVVEDCREQVLDRAEENIFEAAEKGDLAACRFILTTLGKARGYSTRKEIEQPRVRSVEELSSNELLAFRQERLRNGEEIENDLDGQELAVLHEMSN